MQLRKITSLLVVALLMSAFAVAAVGAQAKPDISGKYEGTGKSASVGEVPLKADIKNDNGKITGNLVIMESPSKITSGTYADGKLSMKVDFNGNELVITGMFKDDVITGDWAAGGDSGKFELKKMGAAAAATTPPAAATPPAATKPAAGGDPITGDWDAAADVNGMSIPFMLKLKLEGDKVTGTSERDGAGTPLINGTLVGDKLSFSLDVGGPIINFTSTVKDGKIKGNFEAPGQFSGTWEAKKK